MPLILWNASVFYKVSYVSNSISKIMLSNSFSILGMIDKNLTAETVLITLIISSHALDLTYWKKV